MIRHTVVFKLARGSFRRRTRFSARRPEARGHPRGEELRVLRQISQKNVYDYGLSMEFDSPQDYHAYNNHPDHVTFVQTRWTFQKLPTSWRSTLRAVQRSLTAGTRLKRRWHVPRRV